MLCPFAHRLLYMDTKDSSINREIGLQLKREKAVSRLSVRQLSERTGISESVINRMWSLDPRDINITQITWLAALLDTTPVQVIENALERVGGLGAVMDELREAIEKEKSDVSASNDDLETRRLQKEAEKMSLAEIAENGIAATKNAEHRTDETPAP